MNKFKDYISYMLGGFTLGFSCIFLYHGIFGMTIKPHSAGDYAKTSVMITRSDGRSGGSGVIVSSKRNESKILTNAHVCNVIKYGGIVRSETKKALVKYYQVSTIHDLCLVTVNSNFKINTVMAKDEPKIYDEAIVSGSPHLLPTIVTKGHFSEKQFVNVMTGVRPCTTTEQMDPELGMLCAMIGGLPIIRQYEAQVVSNTIQPGSSGSAVFNEEGELSGLVFAGNGDFSYGLIVPYSYIANFFDRELPRLTETTPVDNPGDPAFAANWKAVCKIKDNAKAEEACELIGKSLLLTN